MCLCDVCMWKPEVDFEPLPPWSWLIFFRTGFSLSGAHSFSKVSSSGSLTRDPPVSIPPVPGFAVGCCGSKLCSSSTSHWVIPPPPVHPSAHGGDTGRERQTVVLSAGQKWSWCFWLILVPSSHVCCSLSISSVAFSKSKSRRNKRTRQQSYNMPVSLRLAARLWADWDAKLIF